MEKILGDAYSQLGYTQSNFDINNVDILIEGIPVMKGSTPITYNIDTMQNKLKIKIFISTLICIKVIPQVLHGVVI